MKEEIVPKEEILTILEQKEYSAEWFFEQWSNNKRNALGALKNFSDKNIGLLISNLRDYLRSQSFFYFNKKSKI